MINFILKKVLPLPKVESFDRYLVVAPHDDDVEIGMGATVAKLLALGKKVTYLICTDGRYGTEDPSITPEQLIEIRKQETLDSAKLYGVEDVRFLPFSDGGFYDYDELKTAVMKVILDVKPQFVFAPDPKMYFEHHLDHINTGRAVADNILNANWAAIAKNYGFSEGAGIQGIGYYYTDKPNSYVKISSKLQKQQFEGIGKHVSQFPTERGPKDICLYLTLRSIRLGAKRLQGRAEGFRVAGMTHIHCAPEALSF